MFQKGWDCRRCFHRHNHAYAWRDKKTNSPWCCIRKRWKQVLTCLQKGLGLLIWIIASGKRKASSIPLGQCAWRTFAPRGGKWQMLVAWPWIRLARLISARLHVLCPLVSSVLCPPGYLFTLSDQASAAAAKPREKNRGPIDLRKKRSHRSLKKT